VVMGVMTAEITESTADDGLVRRSRRRRGGAPLPDEQHSLGYPRRRKNGGHSEAGAQPCRFIARRATNGAPPSEATQPKGESRSPRTQRL